MGESPLRRGLSVGRRAPSFEAKKGSRRPYDSSKGPESKTNLGPKFVCVWYARGMQKALDRSVEPLVQIAGGCLRLFKGRGNGRGASDPPLIPFQLAAGLKSVGCLGVWGQGGTIIFYSDNIGTKLYSNYTLSREKREKIDRFP